MIDQLANNRRRGEIRNKIVWRTTFRLKARKMTLKVCANLFGLGLLVVLVSLSTRISEEIQRGKLLATLIRLIHVYAFGTWLGMQFWVTFVAGIKMYFTLTRHTFGHLQSKLFPVYFTLGSCLSAVSLATYYLMHPVQMWQGTEKLQLSGLAVSLLSTVLCAVYLEPKTTALMMERYDYENGRGYGDSVGPIKDETFKRDDTYLRMTHRFAMVHGFTSMANVLSYTGCVLHLWCLASQGAIA